MFGTVRQAQAFEEYVRKSFHGFLSLKQEDAIRRLRDLAKQTESRPGGMSKGIVKGVCDLLQSAFGRTCGSPADADVYRWIQYMIDTIQYDWSE